MPVPTARVAHASRRVDVPNSLCWDGLGNLYIVNRFAIVARSQYPFCASLIMQNGFTRHTKVV
eukprot:971394-Pleurochrysis_carterae.AAC.3